MPMVRQTIIGEQVFGSRWRNMTDMREQLIASHASRYSALRSERIWARMMRTLAGT